MSDSLGNGQTYDPGLLDLSALCQKLLGRDELCFNI